MTPWRRIAADIGYSAKDVLWWSEPQRIEWLKQQVARQPFTSAWAGVMLNLINNPNQQQKDKDEMKLNDMFPKRVIGGVDLPKPILVEITGVHPEKMRAGSDKPEELKFVMTFQIVNPKNQAEFVRYNGWQYTDKFGYSAVLRKSLVEDIFKIVGVDDTDNLPGKRVVMFGGQSTRNGKPIVRDGETLMSIFVRAPKPTTPAPAETKHDQPTEPAQQAVIESALAQPPA